MKVNAAMGIYRGPTDGPLVFMNLGEINLLFVEIPTDDHIDSANTVDTAITILVIGPGITQIDGGMDQQCLDGGGKWLTRRHVGAAILLNEQGV